MPFGTAVVITQVGRAITAKNVAGTVLAVPKYVAYGTGATAGTHTATNTDTALLNEVESRGTGVATTVTTSTSNDTLQVVGTPASPASTPRNIDEYALFDAPTGGNMFLSGTQPVQALQVGDSLTFTLKCTWS